MRLYLLFKSVNKATNLGFVNKDLSSPFIKLCLLDRTRRSYSNWDSRITETVDTAHRQFISIIIDIKMWAREWVKIKIQFEHGAGSLFVCLKPGLESLFVSLKFSSSCTAQRGDPSRRRIEFDANEEIIPNVFC